MPKIHNTASDWRPGTKRNRIATLCEAGNTKLETYNALRPLVLNGEIVFKANVTLPDGSPAGYREAKPTAEQLIDLKNEIGRVFKLMGRAQTAEWESEEIPASNGDDASDVPGDEDSADDSAPEETPEDEDEPEDEPEPVKPVAAGKQRVKDELAHFLREVRRIRELCISRAATGASLDSISMRPVTMAAKLIPAGVPAAALLHAMLMHWKPELRRNDAGVPDFDFLALSKEIMRKRGITEIIRRNGKREDPHAMFGYALILAENRVPTMLIGPAGTGKSHLCKQLADYLDVNYGETPITPGATRGDLLGRMTASQENPFILSEFAEIYANGGIFNFEEMDAGDPGMLLVLNNALAGDELHNSANGKSYDRSPDFIAMATANTFGTGGNREYTGRERLDAATIDRWRMGRILMEIDESLEEKLLYENI